jgi:23S rRNA (pseudouridine1915-N3)-methyltransferase
MIKVIAVGKLKNDGIKNQLLEYLKRINKFIKIQITEVKASNIKDEEKELSKHIKGKAFVLDALGKGYSSRTFAEMIKKETFGKDISFIIGGASGLSDCFKKNYNLVSLSKMTFPHQVARLMLVEQIYRAFTIIKNMPYDK